MDAEQPLHDEGFGLVEVVVAMLMLAVLALAFLPLLVAGLKQSAANTTLATATQLVNEQMQLAQSRGPSCSGVTSLEQVTTLTDPRGVALQVTTDVDPCVTGSSTVAVTTTVVRSDTGATLATAKTLVFVSP